MSAVEFPAMRDEVLSALAALADVDYQKRTWVDKAPTDPGVQEDLSLIVHILYDDMCVLPDPTEMIGAVVVPGDEVEALKALGVAFTAMLDRIEGVDDATYIEDPEWPEVVRLAGLALAAMVRAGVP